MTGPITPDEVVAKKIEVIPEAVFDVVNELLAAAWDGGKAVLGQDKILDALAARDIGREEAFRGHYLDIEPAYRDAGWNVVYDKPDPGETREAFFLFSRRR